MRRLDHIVVAVRDLDRAAAAYRSLGYQVGGRNRHPWGTENHLIQFGSSFIELIAVGADAHLIPAHCPRRFSFGAFVRDFLTEREGIAMLVLSSEDARGGAARFAEHGIGDFESFYFERPARTPDGSEARVAFTLAFASDPNAPHAGFFVCQQHFPENFWSGSYQQHPNSAMSIATVTLAAVQPAAHTTFLTEFSGTKPQVRPDGGFTFLLGDGRIDVVPPDTPTQRLTLPLFTTMTVGLADTEALVRILRAQKELFVVSGDTIVVPAAVLYGVELRFEPLSDVARPRTRAEAR